MLVSLTSGSAELLPPPPSLVGGKASSLARLFAIPSLAAAHVAVVPASYALSVDFFRPWIDAIAASEAYAAASGSTASNDDHVRQLCAKLKAMCTDLPLSDDQRAALDQLKSIMMSSSWSGIGKNNNKLAAVRSSAPEEDGAAASFAGAFETRLGVTADTLEDAVRHCLASLFDFRVFAYRQGQNRKAGNDGTVEKRQPLAFAVVIMEMIDSHVAGVAFSANPLNSDRDEIVVDASWGLGESVVDGSVTADRFVYNKVDKAVVVETIGKKTQEKRLNGRGGVDTLAINDEQRQMQNSLSTAQLRELADAVQTIEVAYGMPMDVEFAYTESMQLKLLQARPITTLVYLDEVMMTEPGQRRMLYFDYNIVSEATTTTPFTHLDNVLYTRLASWMMGCKERALFGNDPRMPIFVAETRQYANVSFLLRYSTPERIAKHSDFLDPYLASLFRGSDCDKSKYKMKKLPKGVNLRNAWKLIKAGRYIEQYKILKKFKQDPAGRVELYKNSVQTAKVELKRLEARGVVPSEGLEAFCMEVIDVLDETVQLEVAAIMFVVLPLFNGLDKKRRLGKTEEIRSEYDALLAGYDGDELMEMNIEMYRLAQTLGDDIWKSYGHDDLPELATRIQDNLNGKQDDLPREFLDAWKIFMDRFSYDGQDQLFVSCPRYSDSPEFLLAKVRQNVGPTVIDPSVTAKDKLKKRQQIQELQLKRAEKKLLSSPAKKIRKRNEILDHLFWMRNAPKMHVSEACGIIRKEILKIETKFVDDGRIDEAGDIFHLGLAEIDKALTDESLELRPKLLPRKVIHRRATLAPECPLLIDSRCRILRPDPPAIDANLPEGTLVGAAISSGIARGKVRILQHPNEQFEQGEVLAAVVTGPAWTPLFVGCSAVVLQMGGALQHGALCAREFHKPAVSNIDIHAVLKTGMLVEVDGNQGIVKILEEGDEPWLL